MNQLSFLNVSFAFSALLAVSACGASGGDGSGNGIDAGGGAGECVPVADDESNCADGIDNDCDGKIDCENLECSFNAACVEIPVTPVEGCGEATFGGDPLAIPDGNGQVYETSVSITGFDDGQLLETSDGLVSACVVMEHSWLRDLQIEMVCPSGEMIVLQQFLGTNGGELFMGTPNDNDGTNPVPGVGSEYCWTANAVNPPMLEWANANTGAGVLPAGDYRPNGDMNDFVGCTLNGDWKIRAIDDWGSDNGYIFEWTVSFNPDIIPDCGEWID